MSFPTQHQPVRFSISSIDPSITVVDKPSIPKPLTFRQVVDRVGYGYDSVRRDLMDWPGVSKRYHDNPKKRRYCTYRVPLTVFHEYVAWLTVGGSR